MATVNCAKPRGIHPCCNWRFHSYLYGIRNEKNNWPDRGLRDTVLSFIGRPLYWLSYSGHQQLFLPGLLHENSCHRRITFHVSLVSFFVFLFFFRGSMTNNEIYFYFNCISLSNFYLSEMYKDYYYYYNYYFDDLRKHFSRRMFRNNASTHYRSKNKKEEEKKKKKKFRVDRGWRHCRETC